MYYYILGKTILRITFYCVRIHCYATYSYRTDKLNISQAIDEIVRKKGSQFDPELVDLFVSKIAREY